MHDFMYFDILLIFISSETLEIIPIAVAIMIIGITILFMKLVIIFVATKITVWIDVAVVMFPVDTTTLIKNGISVYIKLDIEPKVVFTTSIIWA